VKARLAEYSAKQSCRSSASCSYRDIPTILPRTPLDSQSLVLYLIVHNLIAHKQYTRMETLMKTLYTAHATATGEGRNGHVRTDDGLLEADLKMPKGLGGVGGATNPEQLFAAGYAACFHSAIKFVAGKDKVDVSGSVVSAHVSIGPNESGGFQLAVELEVQVPNLDAVSAQALVESAHQVCPYSNATRGNIEVALKVV
jgi:lipoyl-dependent peroxiredoxin